MYQPSLTEFKERCTRGNLVPVYREILADLETPVSAFLKIGHGKYSYLLESVEGGERIAQYSFLGVDPSVIFRSKGARVEISRDGDTCSFDSTDPFDSLRELMDSYKLVPDPELPRFHGGAVGYVGYDMVRFIEKLPDTTPDDLGLPDCQFMVTDTILIFDHVNHKIKVVTNAVVSGPPEEAYQRAIEKIDALVDLLKQPVPEPAPAAGTAEPQDFRSNFSREAFEEAVGRAKEYIRAGDIFQVVLSQRFSRETVADPVDIYRALRSINPSPYMFYVRMDDLYLVGSSPEILVRVEDDLMQVRPIAGTRPRGATIEEDQQLERDLLADEKELAEHIMLVDLGRNDVGRACEPGSVRPVELMTIERYSHVMHIASHIEGRLRAGEDAYGALRAGFPAGTLSGAPKIRAMEIIEEFEPVKRGIYGGALGYFSFTGNLDTCIIIRTLVIKGRTAYMQAGAGIVADSQPAREYDETVSKARALFRAVELAEQGYTAR